MTEIHGNGIAPFRFLTPFPHPPPVSKGNGDGLEKGRFRRSHTPKKKVNRFKKGQKGG